MEPTFPTTIPVFDDLDPNATLAANNHASRHNKVHAEVAAIAEKVGVEASTDPASIEYRLTEAVALLTSVANDLSALESVAATKAGAEELSNKTLITPTIASFMNAVHNHTNSAGGGTLDGATAIQTGTIPLAQLTTALQALIPGSIVSQNHGSTVKLGNIRVAWGMDIISNAGTTLTFPIAFSTAPTVVCTVNDTNNQTAWVTGRTASTVTMKQLYAPNALYVHWIAIGPA